MAKKSKFKGKVKSSDRRPMTKGKTLRKATIEWREVQKEDGTTCTDIVLKKSMVKDHHGMKAFDASFLMAEYNLQRLDGEKEEAVRETVQLIKQKRMQALCEDMELTTVKDKLEKIRKLALNIQTGRGGVVAKSDPAVVRSSILEILNS